MLNTLVFPLCCHYLPVLSLHPHLLPHALPDSTIIFFHAFLFLHGKIGHFLTNRDQVLKLIFGAQVWAICVS